MAAREDLTLLLLHGLGANAGVWTDVVDALDHPGPVVCPDLAGHGTAPWTGAYTLGALAAGVGDGLAAEPTAPKSPAVIVGHSLGAAVGLELASGAYGLEVGCVVGIGIKSTWTEDDITGMAKVAERGIRWFDDRSGAVDRFLRQSGLIGLMGDDHRAVSAGVTEASPNDEPAMGWRVAQDPRTYVQQPVDMAALLAATTGPVLLGAGEFDEMATEAELRAYTDRVAIAPDAGHNAIVEDPPWVVSQIESLLAEAGL